MEKAGLPQGQKSDSKARYYCYYSYFIVEMSPKEPMLISKKTLSFVRWSTMW